MAQTHSQNAPSLAGWHRLLLAISAVFASLLVALGGVVCVTQSGGGCPDWPGCYGQIIPPMQTNSIIEFTHRLVAGLAGPLILASAIVSWRRARRIRWISYTTAAAVFFTAAVVYFGARAVLVGLPRGLAAVDLGSALLVVAMLVTAAIMPYTQNTTSYSHLSLNRPSALAAAFALLVVYIAMISGVLAASSGSLIRCMGWLLFSPPLLQIDQPGWINILRLAIGITGILFVIAALVLAWRDGFQTSFQRRIVILTAILFAIELLAAGLLLVVGPHIVLLLVYIMTAAAFWAALVALAVICAATSIKSKGYVSAPTKLI